MKVRALHGADLQEALPDLARLRIEVFRDWPYLYDGDLAYEESYLRPYVQSARAIVVGAFEDGCLVGASTGAPLVEHAEDFGQAFETTDLDLAEIFYCAESVLLPRFRGRGIGHQFFELREAHARDLGFVRVAFCGVVRPQDHPDRPASYRALDGFWRGRGYQPLPGVVAEFKWKDLRERKETAKSLQFWMKDL